MITFPFKVGSIQPFTCLRMATPKNGSVTLDALRDSTAELAAWRGQVVSRTTTSHAELALARLRRRRGEHERRGRAVHPTHKR